MNTSLLSALADDARTFQAIFESLPGNHVLIKADAPRYTILASTSSHLAQTGRTRESIVGKGTFEAFPGDGIDGANAGIKALEASYNHVMRYKEAHYLPVQRYDLQNEDGSFTERYWRASNHPVFAPGGAVAYIIHTSEDITKELKIKEQEERIKGLEQAYRLFMQAPFAIHIFTGPELIIDLANPPTLVLWGRTEEVTGQRFLDVLPELRGQGYDTMMQEVMQTGNPRFFYEVPLHLNRPGKDPVGYFNFIYQPYYKDGVTHADSIMVIANEVTEQVHARKKEAESEAALKQFKFMADQAREPFILMRADGSFAYLNKSALLAWGYTEEEAKKLRVPDIDPIYNNEIFSAAFARAQTEELPTFETLHRRKDGMIYPVEVKMGGLVLNDEQYTFAVARDITERKKAEAAIQEREAQLKAVIEQTPAPTLVLRGNDFRIEHINGPMMQLIGREENLIGQSLLDIMPELHGQFVWEQVMKVYQEGIDFDQQEVLAWHNRTGEIKDYYYNVAYRPLKEDGKITGIIQVAIDVSAQVKAQQDLKESQRQLTAIFEQSPAAIAILGKNNLEIQQANPFYCAIVGRKREDILGKPLLEALPEVAGQGFDDMLYGVIESGVAVTAAEMPAQLLHNGHIEQIYVDLSYNPVQERDGSISGVFVVANDVTQQVKARKKIQESEENLKSIVLGSPVGMCVIDAATLVSEIVNESFIEIAGKSYDDIVGHKYWDTFTETKLFYRNALLEVIEKGTPFYANEVELTLIRHGQQQTVYVTFVYMPLKNSDGAVTKVAIYVLENTPQVVARHRVQELVIQRTIELAQANENLQQMNKELQRSNANLEEFAHAASHDLKEPIRKITFFTNQLKAQLGDRLRENELRSFGRIENASERMGALIDDLLLYSHVSQRPHQQEAVDLNEKVKRVLEDLELDIQQKKAVINLGKLPVVQGYKRQLQQLFQNLISNALKYSKTSELPVIDISAGFVTEHGKPYQLITVKDNGIGFEQEYADKIFQMFARLHGKAEYSGTGVGLSIVKKVVENHNGLIRVESKPGLGSTFQLLLPEK